MQLSELRIYCLQKKESSESMPFGEEIIVFKVLHKIFAITHIFDFRSVNLKCNPDYAQELRDEYEAVIPGYHMNKKHWNTIYFNQDVSNSFVFQLIDHSYEQVIKGFTKKQKEELGKI